MIRPYMYIVKFLVHYFQLISLFSISNCCKLNLYSKHQLWALATPLFVHVFTYYPFTKPGSYYIADSICSLFRGLWGRKTSVAANSIESLRGSQKKESLLIGHSERKNYLFSVSSQLTKKTCLLLLYSLLS